MTVNHLFMLLGGLALFLYGMKLMSDGLKLVAGYKLKKVLEKLTKNRYIGALLGVGVTAIIQSSTATTLMVIGFVNANLITLTGAAGVIIGAMVGTTITNFLFAFNIQTITPLIIFFGVVLTLFTKRKKFNHVGMILLGFGILFLGLNLMSNSMYPLRDMPFMEELFLLTRNPLFGIFIGFAVTSIIQSSTATMGILFAMITAGIIIDLDQALFIIYGLNLGTCTTALIATIGSGKTAKQAVAVQIIFNLLGMTVFLLLALVGFDLASLIRLITDNVSFQLVYAHLIYNLVITIIFLPLSGYIVKMAKAIVTTGGEDINEFKFNYIDQRLLDNPSISLEQTAQEINRMMDFILDDYIVNSDPNLVESGLKKEEVIIYLNKEINKFLMNLNTLKLEDKEIQTVMNYYKNVASLERISRLSKELSKAIKAYKKDPHYSEKDMKNIQDLIKSIQIILEKSFETFKVGQVDQNKIDIIKGDVQRIKKSIDDKKMMSINVVRITSNLNRVANHALNIAKTGVVKTTQEKE